MLQILNAIASFAVRNPPLFWMVVGAVLLTIAAILARGWYIARLRARLSASSGRTSGHGQGDLDTLDPWTLVQHLIAKGDYTEAAHALYRHILDWLALRERLELHPSRTVGDYSRELRARSSRFFARYRDFARTYEYVVYGVGVCDRDRFDRLLALARAMKEQQ